MEQTLINRQNLAKRWDYTSTKVIENYEADGILTRVPGLPSPRYSLEEVMKIETVGEINPLSPLERRRLEKENAILKKERDLYKSKLTNIQELINGQIGL